MAMLRRTASTLNRIINSKVVSSNWNSFASPTVATHKITKSQLVPVTCRFYSSEIDFTDVESRRRMFNRLLYRSKQRGFLELDLVLGNWVEDNIQSMDENGIKSLIQVLDLENPDLWNWLSGQEQPPESISVNPVFTAVREKVASNLNNHAAPETRATPGQPWVRGWDDIKRGKDSPVSGNQ
ncbi:succinate dehydrogenase assembly factor 2, mitochondrial [Beta vulgaris subsp. vulgaris]|uniref:succinate dehydrogenase assembly factor 2, mitochondrial n=1 Tax=Beta vulgaris subsp. vulgaris TaxID=3555 RepID=UPI002036F53F|nr:succinate dehydrogenase assembly factor 2, mitochondrial [Beta vulgaris subsp. vulgaris]XP_010667022.2 succinate dehydrogenase assembly factor 2, mitochondrial [Beta vulgaris subsp. vulgaris]XP_010667023.2 succinate dehydrogenase assembly factor 2, mitochondrial [Beta vulgaris subsp. vulgaris]XP_010667024.2 succinate dehydrogenase assembly factor 2, mitochondrial [Beta vulgaris subsp. vulgaris]